eukprot:9489595-Pyramimonas_sp.AAC.1
MQPGRPAAGPAELNSGGKQFHSLWWPKTGAGGFDLGRTVRRQNPYYRPGAWLQRDLLAPRGCAPQVARETPFDCEIAPFSPSPPS